MKFTCLGLVASAALFAAASADADITYIVDHTYGVDSVTGSITTDGSTGTLASADFVSWDLTISDGTNSFTLNQGNSFESNSTTSNIYATSTDLLFDFGPPAALFYFADNSGVGAGSSICWSSTGVSGCNISTDSTPGASIVVGNDIGAAQIAGLSGSAYVIGFVPEPAAWALMVGGIAGLGAALRARRRATAIV